MLFFILKNEMCPHLAYLHNSVNQYFSNDQIKCYRIIHQQKKFPSARWPLDFNRVWKLIDGVSDYLWQLIFKKSPLVKFWHSIKGNLPVSEKAIKILFLFQLLIHMRLNLITLFQPNNILQQIKCRNRRMQLSSIQINMRKNVKRCWGTWVALVG